MKSCSFASCALSACFVSTQLSGKINLFTVADKTERMCLFISCAADMFDVIMFSSLVGKRRVFSNVQSKQKAFEICCVLIYGADDGAKKALGS